ncbi:MAG: inorganic phosphate transporter [Bacteroidetes bacterium]|nr:inorganic phosphate transporter [Bacteroidota bacterium]
MTLLVIVIALALIFDFINGFHDAANSIATIVSTKVLTPFQAVLWAAFFNCVAFLIFKDHAVANTIGKTVYSDFISLPVICSGLIAAIIWNLLTWWYGIPSSSSHTLIGGFAGSAIAYAFLSKGMMPISEIIDSDKIGKTLLFILLAPIIGMIISIFFTLIFIQHKTWLKVGILTASAVVLWFLFIGFQENKLNENMSKFFKVDKYQYAIDIKHDSTQVHKLEKAKEKAAACAPYLTNYEFHGSDRVVEDIVSNVDLKDITISKLGDKLNLYFKIDQVKNKAKLDTTHKAEYVATQKIVDSLKPITKKYFELGAEGMVAEMNAMHPIAPDKIAAFKKAMKIDIKADLKKEVEKADNKIVRWGLVGALMLFALMFIYNEKIKEPTAKRTSAMFKRSQLLSSAAFSVGHGGNDAQKVMGIIAAALVANGSIVDIKSMPDWVPISCYLAIGIGTLSGGWKIVKTMGTKITKVTPLEGVCAETAGATTLFLTEQMGIPVSTTHTITGAIIGVGATKGVGAVKWGVTISLLWAWILTIPISAILGAFFYWIFSLFL